MFFPKCLHGGSHITSKYWHRCHLLAEPSAAPYILLPPPPPALMPPALLFPRQWQSHLLRALGQQVLLLCSQVCPKHSEQAWREEALPEDGC